MCCKENDVYKVDIGYALLEISKAIREFAAVIRNK
jgi:hypothetical protein